MEFSAVQPDGSTRLLDVKDFIPDSMIKSQEIKVSVSGGSAGGTGGGTSSCTVTFNSMGGSRIDSVSVDRNGTLKEPKERRATVLSLAAGSQIENVRRSMISVQR